jgi:N-acetylglutamate synthase-like GNAT family acetyltransferase
MTQSEAGEFCVREATADEAPRVVALLAQNHQSTHDVLAPGTRYWVAEGADRQCVGAVGLELGRDVVLLRSAGVLPAWRGCGVGTALTRRAVGAALRAGYRAVYLFSTGAGDYWKRFGFHEVTVAELLTALPDAPQVREYEIRGWLPTEVAWRRDLAESPRGRVANVGTGVGTPQSRV